MKKSKLKSLVKSARKTAEKDIRLSLKNNLKEIAAQFGESKKLSRDIEKGSKILAKKLAKDIKIDKSSFIKKDDAVIIEADHQIIAAESAVTTPEPAAGKAKKTKAVNPEEVPAETDKV